MNMPLLSMVINAPPQRFLFPDRRVNFELEVQSKEETGRTEKRIQFALMWRSVPDRVYFNI